MRKVINGNATLTSLGGSIMPPGVLSAMEEASRHFVDIDELQRKAGERIAELTRNQAAYVSCGAAAGMVLATSACMAGFDPEKRARLPDTGGMKNEVIVHRHGRVDYDFAIRQTGARLVEIGSQNGASPEELEEAIGEKTAAIFYFYIPTRMDVQVPIETGIEIGHGHGIPVIVDAAAQLPPVENLWRFTGMGADLVLFSGGKGLRGPQSSGLMLGKRELIEKCAFHACPRKFIGRPMKVGKEEIAGLLAAVEQYVDLDHGELMERYEEQVKLIVDNLSVIPGLTARRSFPSEAGQPMPRAEILVDEGTTGLTRDKILEILREGQPAIDLAPSGERGMFVNPQTLRRGEEKLVTSRIQEAIHGK